MGIAKGAGSLVKGTIKGAFGTIEALTGAFGTGFSTIMSVIDE